MAAGENNCPIIAEYVNMPASFGFMRAKRAFYFDSICVNRNYIVVAKYFVGREWVKDIPLFTAKPWHSSAEVSAL